MVLSQWPKYVYDADIDKEFKAVDQILKDRLEATHPGLYQSYFDSSDAYMELLKQANEKEWKDEALNKACGQASLAQAKLDKEIRDAEPQLCKERTSSLLKSGELLELAGRKMVLNRLELGC